jgi:membrane fusion protein, macrolide-specific efflux system
MKKLSTHRIIWLLATLAVFVAAGTLGYHWAFGKPKVQYVTAVVERGDVESTVVAAGVLQPLKYVDVGAQTSGQLKSLKVARGDRVDKGQLLAEIDPVLAKTALASEKATLRDLTAQRETKRAQLSLATLQKDRYEALSKANVIAPSEGDITRSAYEVAVATVNSLTEQMKVAAEAVKTAEANLGYTKITAPMAGEVVSLSILEGQTINDKQQAPTILRIADLSTMTVWAQVSDADIVRIKVGQDVYFTVLGQAERRRTGKVRQILPTPELINNVLFYDVLFDVANPERELKIQMTAQVFVVLARAKGVLLIPNAALGNADEQTDVKVLVLKANGTVEQRAITIGIKSELYSEVKDGLNENEHVILREIKPKVAAGSALSSRKAP